MAKKLYEESNIRDIADAIRESNGSTDSYKPSEMAGAIRGINEFVDFMTTIGFQTAVFPNNYDLYLYVPNITGFQVGAFNNTTGLRSITLKNNNKDLVWNGTNVFYCSSTGASTLELIDLREFSTKIMNGTNCFFYNRKLTRILGELDFTNATTLTNCFALCDLLQSVTIKKESVFVSVSFSHSALLTDESIQNIIDALADLTGKTSQTVTFHSSVTTKLTDEQYMTIVSKNWLLG